MSIVKAIGDFFRGGKKDHKGPVDRYQIISPLLATQKYVDTAQQVVSLLEQNKTVVDLIAGRNGHHLPMQAKGIDAYHHYVQGLSGSDRSKEKASPFSTMSSALNAITTNLDLIEDKISEIFDIDGNVDESNLRTSAVMVIGYIETANQFTTWIGNLLRHLTVDDHETIPPFETKTLLLKAPDFGSFASFNLDQWNGHNGSILSDVKAMQRSGSDVAVKSGENWLDTFVHDGQFSHREQSLMSASLRNPIMMAINWDMSRRQAEIDLLSVRNEWLISKIDQESRKMQGLGPDSPEYKQLKKATDHYANVISQHEQRIGRLRA